MLSKRFAILARTLQEWGFYVPAQRRLLELVDVLVDGPYVEAQRDTDLLFRGSANQRLINVPRSLAEGAVVLWQRT